MPFGRKATVGGTVVDFDVVYRDLIVPAIEKAGLDPLRADEELTGGIIHKPMFERLILCEYAMAELTTANANVFYELGLRHAVRPASTVTLYAEDSGQLPFDVAPLRAIPCRLSADGAPVDTATILATLAERLREARHGASDSPMLQLVEGFPDIQRLKTGVFRERVAYPESLKQRLAAADRIGRASGHCHRDARSGSLPGVVSAVPGTHGIAKKADLSALPCGAGMCVR